MSYKLRFMICLCLLAALCLSFASLSAADETAMTTVTWTQFQQKSESGALLALDLEALGENVCMADGVAYGYESRRYKTWFEVADAALWQEAGLTPPQGVLSWAELMEMAQAVMAYNQQKDTPLLLLATQPQRFPRRFALLEQAEIQKQWEAVQPAVGAAGQPRALLTECVLALYDIGSKNYVTAIEHDGAVYALSGPEAQIWVIPADAGDPEAAKAQLLKQIESATPVETGVIPPEMTMAQLKEIWNIHTAMPSEINFELWRQGE